MRIQAFRKSKECCPDYMQDYYYIVNGMEMNDMIWLIHHLA